MWATNDERVHLGQLLRSGTGYFRRPVVVLQTYDAANLRPDLIAGLRVALLLFPQAVAYAHLAGLPVQVGLYTAVVGAVVGALWGSSQHVQSGPVNTISLLVLSTLASVAAITQESIVVLAGLIAVLVGTFQTVVGVARLGILVNFVSHSVIVGITSGAGLLIAVAQVRDLLGLTYENHTLFHSVSGFVNHVADTQLVTLAMGLGTILLVLVLVRFIPKLPAELISMVVAAVVLILFDLESSGVSVLPQLPEGSATLARLPLFNLELIGRVSAGTLAIAAIGLVEATTVARNISSKSGQRLDTNQEFVGQGLANIAAGFLSGYPCSGSSARSAANYDAGARSPLASVFSGLFVIAPLLALDSWAAYVPRATMAGVLIVMAYKMIDRREIVRIWSGTRGDAAIMLVTFLGTLFLEIEFAVLAGILLSFARYIMRSSSPRVISVVPDDTYQHFAYLPERSVCPQLGVVDVMGDLYFGAVNHVEEAILSLREKHPSQRYLLLRMNHVNHCDFSGIHMLETVLRSYRDQHGDIFLMRVSGPVWALMESTGFCDRLTLDHFLSEDVAIGHIFHRVLDPAVCIYECPVRVFKECQNLPKKEVALDITLEQEEFGHLPTEWTPQGLWDRLHAANGEEMPRIIDVREPREYQRGHIPQAELIPLPDILGAPSQFTRDRFMVLVCRTGRRSRRAARALEQAGITNVAILQGGMLAWEASGLLEAVESG